MNVLKKLIIAIITCNFLFITPIFANSKIQMNLFYDNIKYTYDADPINLVINGETITGLPMPPIILNDSTLVPAREIFEPLGATVSWNPDGRIVLVSYQDTLISLKINSTSVNKDGREISVDTPPKIINDKTMIPLRLVSELLGFNVEWDAKTRTASISVPEAMVEIPFTPDIAVTPEPIFPDILEPIPTLEPMPVPTLEPMPVPTFGSMPVPTFEPMPVPTFEPTPVPTIEPTPTPPALNDISAGEIISEEHPTATMAGIILPSDEEQIYIIRAHTPITNVSKLVLPDNRVVIDIYNATLMSELPEVVVDSGIVSTIRMAQNQITPEKVVRVVFNLKDISEYSVSLSEDRQNIFVAFQKNAVKDIDLTSDNEANYLKIITSYPTPISISELEQPLRLVIDIPSGEMQKVLNEIPSQKLISKIRSEQLDASTSRIELELSNAVEYTYSSSSKKAGNEIMIKLTEVPPEAITYDYLTKTIVLSKESGIRIDNIQHTDQYNSTSVYNSVHRYNHKYIMTFPSNPENAISSAMYPINDAYLNSIHVQANSMGQTQLTLDEKLVLATSITEDQDNVYIKLIRPKDKHSYIVIIDPGHGGVDPGATGNGLTEKNINLDIANRVMALLEQNSRIKAYATRTTDIKIELLDRASFANQIGDLFVSIHINSMGNSSPKANGTESYYYAHSFDSTAGISSQRVAQILQNNLLSALGSLDRKVKTADFAVIRETSMPAALLEIGFISNPGEAAKLGTAEYRQKTAQAIYSGIVEIFSTYTPRR